jgi:hypothetical protein
MRWAVVEAAEWAEMEGMELARHEMGWETWSHADSK